MGDETPNAMNLDLNLGPFPSSPDIEQEPESLPNEPMNLEDWIDGRFNRLRGTITVRARQRWRSVWRQAPIPPETRSIALELMVNSSSPSGGSLQTGEGSVAPEERNAEVIKTCESNATHVENEVLGKKEDEVKVNAEEGSFFDCNICLDLAGDPVVTCCGHLFCWPCLYRWLHIHSDVKECPVCKGEVTTKNVTPIYGRGNNARKAEEDLSLKVPLRPPAQRIESWRQTIQRNRFTVPMEEMIRRLGSRFDLTRDLAQVQPHNSESAQDSPERNISFLNQILTSRGLRREQNAVVPPDDVVDVNLTQGIPANSEVGRQLSSFLLRSREQDTVVPPDDVLDVNLTQGIPGNSEVGRQLSSLVLRRSRTQRVGALSDLMVDYFRNNPVERNQERPPPVDDRDSVSSIAAVIHSESQTVDTAVEIDSTVSLSTSSSRRRNDASRVDSGDSRTHRRRRLN